MDSQAAHEVEALKRLGILVTHGGIESSSLSANPGNAALSSNEVSGWAGFLPTDNIFMLAHFMNDPAPLHTHDYIELSYVLSGSLVNVVDGKRLYMLAGSLCAMNLNSSHRLEPNDPNTALINVGLRPDLFRAGVFKDFLEDDNVMARFLRGETGSSYLFFSDATDRTLLSTIINMAEAYSKAGGKQSFELSARVLLFLDHLSKTPAYSFYGVDARAMKMLDYIREHSADISIKALAKAFGYSENYCTRFIKKHTGRTASEIIADARMAKAELLLSTTDLSNTAVAEAVGYKSYSHFNDLFRSYHGMTPGDYRRLASSGLL